MTLWFVMVLVMYTTGCCHSLADPKTRSMRYVPQAAMFRVLSLDEMQDEPSVANNALRSKPLFVSRIGNIPSMRPSLFADDDESMTHVKVMQPGLWYPPLKHRNGDFIGYSYKGQSAIEKGKRFFDSLGGSEVHGFKRGMPDHLRSAMKEFQERLNEIHMNKNFKNMYDEFLRANGRVRRAANVGGKSVETLPHTVIKTIALDEALQQHMILKRSLDSLGGFQVHGWKRDDEKRALDSLGDFQVHGWKRDGEKRALDSLGGFQVHGWKRDDEKRALDSLGGFQVHGWKRPSIEAYKSALDDSLDGFQVRVWKKRGVDYTDGIKFQGNHYPASTDIHGNVIHLTNKNSQNLQDKVNFDRTVTNDEMSVSKLSGSNYTNEDSIYPNDQTDDKRALDSLGGYQVHGWKRPANKRTLDSLGSFQVHGWKRDEEKRALDSLGDFQVHGWKRDEEKRALDSLGGFQVHGWKRDDGKRALDSLGGFQVHGWKREEKKRALDSLGGFQVHGWKRGNSEISTLSDVGQEKKH